MEKTSETKTSRRMTALLNHLTAKPEMTLPNRANRRFKFQKRSQLFIGTHNEPLSVTAMCIANETVRRGENPRCSADVSSGVSFD